MYSPPPRVDYSTADTSRFDIEMQMAPLLASLISKRSLSISARPLTPHLPHIRIKSAPSVFGALKTVITSLSVDLRVKGRIYNDLVLSILLYGSEAWCLREDLFNRLHSFYNRCVRAMCRITMVHTIKHRITSKSLFERLGVGSFDSYYNRLLLRWAGHVARIPVDRMPSKPLTGWVEYARPVGCPQMTWGRTLNKALNSYDLPTDF
jgi:hypothetical protein